MSAETLRAAAALMRERAKNAVGGTGASDWFPVKSKVRSSGGLVCESASFEAEHIASWHPAVALAVADLLDVTAEWVERDAIRSKLPMTQTDEAALTVATTYLGESA